MLSILSVDLEGDLEPGNSIGLMAEGQTIYASSDNLYVATSPWMAWPATRWEEGSGRTETLTTQIHMFDISNPDTAIYAASGEVEGVLQSQWSMDENEGILRVVVTDENPWWGSSDVPDSAVVTMERRGEELVQDRVGRRTWEERTGLRGPVHPRQGICRHISPGRPALCCRPIRSNEP